MGILAPDTRLPRAGTIALLLCLAPTALQAQRSTCTQRHPRVDDVRFTGVHRLPLGVIAPILVTERTALLRRWFGWDIGPLTCLDSADLVADAAAIANEYQQRGFVGVRVNATVQRDGDRRARVTFAVHEGVPITIRRVSVVGLPAAAADSAALTRRLVGEPMDDSVVHAVADSVQALLRDAGHARAAPRTVRLTADSAARTGTVRMEFFPGALSYIAAVRVQITPSGPTPVVGETVVRSAFGVRVGDQFSARRVADGQRELAALDLYRLVRIDTASVAAAGGGTAGGRDSIGIAIAVVEGDRRRARTIAGWGTLDCVRAQARLLEQNFLALGHRLEVSGRVSKLGVAEPFSGLQSFCAPRVRDDPFSQQLNYYVGATTRLRGVPTFGLARVQPEVTVFSERRSFIGTYEQTTELGVLAATQHVLAPRLNLALQYAYTDSRTRADRAVSCTRFGFCRLEDVASFVLRSPQHTVGGSLVKNPLLPSDDPQGGGRWAADVRYGHASVGKILPIDFARFTLEGARYVPLSGWLLLALHVQAGGVIAPADRSFLLPPGERFYGGGQNSVRGFGQNLLGPGSYIVTAIDTIAGPGGMQVGQARADVEPQRIAPSGGNAMWVGNVELRTRAGWPNDLLRWVVFLDAGRVWNTRDVFSVTNADVRATPGVGVRLITPLGPFRLDVGYNPNGVEPGPAFLVQPGDVLAGVAGRAICVSPGSDDPLVLAPGVSPSAASCPATFAPPRSRALLSRLTFHFSLGNAF
jgi:outer membrane protein insertion porin family/translocation and assembly module TamA